MSSLNEGTITFFKYFLRYNDGIRKNTSLPYPYLLVFHDNFLVSYNTKETNKLILWQQ
jgi:hypothetical protein